MGAACGRLFFMVRKGTSMKCTILHEGQGRMRVHVCNVRMTLHRADVLEAYLNHHDAIEKATVYEGPATWYFIIMARVPTPSGR